MYNIMSELTLKDFSANQTVTADNLEQFETALRDEVEKSLAEYKKLIHKNNTAAATRSRQCDQNIIAALKFVRKQKIETAKQIRADRKASKAAASGGAKAEPEPEPAPEPTPEPTPEPVKQTKKSKKKRSRKKKN